MHTKALVCVFTLHWWFQFSHCSPHWLSLFFYCSHLFEVELYSRFSLSCVVIASWREMVKEMVIAIEVGGVWKISSSFSNLISKSKMFFIMPVQFPDFQVPTSFIFEVEVLKGLLKYIMRDFAQESRVSKKYKITTSSISLALLRFSLQISVPVYTMHY